MVLAILTSNVYVPLAVALGVAGISFFLLPYLYSKFPNIFLKIIEIASYKRTIETTYYFIASVALPNVSKTDIDRIWNYLEESVDLAERLAKSGKLPKEDRKEHVMEATKKFMALLEIELTVEIESFVSNAIELAVKYMDLVKK